MKDKVPAPKKGAVSTPRDELFQLMFDMGRLMKREMQAGVDMSIGYLSLETLRYIEEQENGNGTPDMQCVADYLRVQGPSATRLIASLVTEGYLARVPDSNDRRRVLLSVTPKGKRALADAMRARQEVFKRIVAPLSDRDCAQLARILDIITRSH